MRSFLRACLVWMLLAGPAVSQDAAVQVLIVDSDRLFVETQYGRKIAEELSAQATQLQAENDEIAAQLTQEERALTLARADMTPEEFRAAAEAFDARVQEVRQARDAKNVELQQASVDLRTRFEERVQGIVANIMLERDAVMVLEQRTVKLSVRSVNITDDAIARIDAVLGDGTE